MSDVVEVPYLGAAGLRELDEPRFHALLPRAFAFRRRARSFDGVTLERLRTSAIEVRNVGASDRLSAIECVFVETARSGSSRARAGPSSPRSS